MFDMISSVRDNEPHQSGTFANIWPWHFDNLGDLLISSTTSQPLAISEMEPNPPVSPTATVSPTSSEHSLTPTSPTLPHFRSIWGSRTLTLQSPVRKLSTAGLQSPMAHQRSTLELILASPDYQSFSRRRAQRDGRKTTHPAGVDSIAYGTTRPPTKYGQLTLMKVDEDGDVAMASPPPSPRRSIMREDSTSSPILSTLVSIPLQESLDHLWSEEDMSTRQLSQKSSSDDANSLFPEIACSQPQSSFSKTSRSHRYDLRPRKRRCAISKDGSQDLSTSQLGNPSTKSTSASPIPTRLVIHNPHKAQLENSIHHLGIPLVPLVSVSTGLPHPQFPHSILQYHLLTHEQLDSLARWYHQTIDNARERYMYPAVIERPWMWSEERDANANVAAGLTVKRRRFGRFIGLRGCDSPVVPVRGNGEVEEEREETVTERMEREWQEALRRAEEEERLQEKMWRGRW